MLFFTIWNTDAKQARVDWTGHLHIVWIGAGKAFFGDVMCSVLLRLTCHTSKWHNVVVPTTTSAIYYKLFYKTRPFCLFQFWSITCWDFYILHILVRRVHSWENFATACLYHICSLTDQMLTLIIYVHVYMYACTHMYVQIHTLWLSATHHHH